MAKLRGTVFFIYMTATAIALTIGFAPTLLFGRRGGQFSAKSWCRMVLFGLRGICGITTRLEGARHLPVGPTIVAANHQSMWETLYLFTVLERPTFVVKRELLQVPIFGFWLARTGAIAIDRSAGPRALKQLTNQASERLAEGGQIVIFPEGTRTRPGVRRRFHPGVAAIYADTGASCVPAGHDSGRHWCHPGPAKIPGEICIRFGPAISPGLDRREFMSQLSSRIGALRPDLTDAVMASHSAPEIPSAEVGVTS